jgi:glutamate racemase
MRQVAAPSIGVLDSGIGGLSVLREIHQILPQHPTLYVADQFHLPYGPRPVAELRAYVQAIAEYLMREGAMVIVLACNTASAAALYDLREKFPGYAFVGMEPALKPAVEHTRTGVVGVLSTRTTAEGLPYQRLLSRFAEGVRVITRPAPELVHLAEEQRQDTPEGRAIIAEIVLPMVAQGVDTFVLACTHFPFVAQAIQEVVGPGVRLIDPSPAVARQTARVLPPDMPPASAPHRYLTTGSPALMRTMLKTLVNIEAEPLGLRWQDGALMPADVTFPRR